MNTILLTLELIGIVTASVSGAMQAIAKKVDMIGVVLLGMITALGGGITRDILLGDLPPRSFSNQAYLWSALIPPCVVFFVAWIFRSFYTKEEELIDRINNFVDALGLGAFAIGGAGVARAVGFEGHAVVVIVSGVVTAVGGGMLRDVLLREIPFILKKRIYALAALAGTIIYYLLYLWGAGEILASVLGVLVVFVLRICATVFRWNMPKAIP